MTFTPLELDLNKYGILSGQLYQPEVHSVGQLEYPKYKKLRLCSLRFSFVKMVPLWSTKLKSLSS